MFSHLEAVAHLQAIRADVVERTQHAVEPAQNAQVCLCKSLLRCVESVRLQALCDIGMYMFVCVYMCVCVCTPAALR